MIFKLRLTAHDLANCGEHRWRYFRRGDNCLAFCGGVERHSLAFAVAKYQALFVDRDHLHVVHECGHEVEHLLLHFRLHLLEFGSQH